MDREKGVRVDTRLCKKDIIIIGLAIITLIESEFWVFGLRLASEHSIVSFRFCPPVLEPSDYLKEKEEKNFVDEKKFAHYGRVLRIRQAKGWNKVF